MARPIKAQVIFVSRVLARGGYTILCPLRPKSSSSADSGPWRFTMTRPFKAHFMFVSRRSPWKLQRYVCYSEHCYGYFGISRATEQAHDI